MCVIAIADKVRPRPEMIEAMYDHNQHGAGFAWRENGKIRWKKGLTLEEALRVSAEIPLPYVAHFRISTVGGTPASLTHPFEVSPEASVALEGTSKNPVLFHNGHWGDWQKESRQLAVASGGKYKMPPGKWSDSRGMAWCAGILGMGFLETIDGQKIAVIGPHKGDLTMYGTWFILDDVIVSNKGFDRTYERLCKESDKSSIAVTPPARGSLSPTEPVVRQHNSSCVCEDCRENATKADFQAHSPVGGGTLASTPFQRARDRYMGLIKLKQEGKTVGKNKLKKALAKMNREMHKEIDREALKRRTQVL